MASSGQLDSHGWRRASQSQGGQAKASSEGMTQAELQPAARVVVALAVVADFPGQRPAAVQPMAALQADGADIAGDQLLLLDGFSFADGQPQARVIEARIVIIQREVMADWCAGIGNVGDVQGVARTPGIPVTLGTECQSVHTGAFVLSATKAGGA